MNTIPAEHFVGTIAKNVDNKKLSDADFREFVRNTLPIVEYRSVTPLIVNLHPDEQL